MGRPGEDRAFIFNGDFVDRGPWGLELLLLLAAWKAALPGRVWLLRGNHESQQCTQHYGFLKELKAKYGSGGGKVGGRAGGGGRCIPAAAPRAS